jgi:hypothetical protein
MANQLVRILRRVVPWRQTPLQSHELASWVQEQTPSRTEHTVGHGYWALLCHFKQRTIIFRPLIDTSFQCSGSGFNESGSGLR